MKGAALDVFVLDTLVGHLVDDFDRYVFTYLPGVPAEYLVSLTMPVRAESYVWKRGLFPFFMQNLPEGFQKQVIRERLRKSLPCTQTMSRHRIGNAVPANFIG